MSINVIDDLLRCIDYFLWLTIPFVSSNRKDNSRYFIYTPLYFILIFLLNHMNLTAAAAIKTGSMISFSFAQYFWPYMNLLINESLQTVYFKQSHNMEWLDALAVSLLLSVFRYSSFILQDLVVFGVFADTALPFAVKVFNRTVCTLPLMLWFRKLRKGMTDFSVHDKSVYSAILFLFVIIEYRLRVNYLNTLDFLLGVLSITIPLTISELIKNRILMNHYVMNQESIRSTGKFAENELSVMREYEALLSKSKHDMLHHFNKIHQLIEAGKYSQAQKYIETEMQDTDTAISHHCCDNIYVNTVIKSQTTAHPETDITVESNIGKDCRIDPLDLGLIVLFLIDTPISKASAENLIHLELCQTEQMVIIAEHIVGMDIKKELTSTDLMLIGNTIEKYEGSILWNVKNTGDIVILLREN